MASSIDLSLDLLQGGDGDGDDGDGDGMTVRTVI